MKQAALISFLWGKHVCVLEQYLATRPRVVITLRGAITVELRRLVSAGGGTLVALEDLLDPGEIQTIMKNAAAVNLNASHAMSEKGWVSFAENMQLDAERVKPLITDALLPCVQQGMFLVEALEKASREYFIELLVVNEDWTYVPRCAVEWAKTHRIPSLHLFHSIALVKTYTVHSTVLSDVVAVYGKRGTESLLDAGVPKERIRVTGNPAWDIYPALRERREHIKHGIFTKYGLNRALPLVVFGTTWDAKLTAISDADEYRRTLGVFLSACQTLIQDGVSSNFLVKDRPPNFAVGKETIARIADDLHLPRERFFYATADTEALVISADIVISIDSNLSVEAMLAGVPAINLIETLGLRLGPSFDGQSGILDVGPAELSTTIRLLLDDAPLRGSLVEAMRAKADYYNVGQDGKATERVVALMAEIALKCVGNATPLQDKGYVWEELAKGEEAELKGEYHNLGRRELVEMFVRKPRMVLEIGCATGATGALIKKVYPNAYVMGVELNLAAAHIAEHHIDKVYAQRMEDIDFAAEGIAKRSIDTVILGDVLEHMVDPWSTMARLKPFLAPDAQVLASIPNIRNLWILNELAQGRWRYEKAGLLDVTHLRFFTLEEIKRFFRETGYIVLKVACAPDARCMGIQNKDGIVNVDTGKIVIKNVGPDELMELKTLQFLILAMPSEEALPANVIKQVRLADQHVLAGDLPAAQHALSQALKLAPDDPELIVAYGNILLRVGDVAAARREFVKATVLAPEYAPAHSNLAAVLLHLGRAEEAEASARRALALNLADTDALKVMARVCLDSERYTEAVQAYVAILRVKPDDLETLLVAGNCYAEAGRPEEAKRLYQRVLQLDPGNAVAADNLAVVNSKEYEVSAPISSAARATNDRVEVSSRQDTDTTLSYQSVSADSGDAQTPPAWPANVIEQVRLADQHVLAGDLPAAQHALSQALKLAPDDPELIVAYGNILLRGGDVEAARREFVKATVLAPEDAAAHSNLAAVLLHLGRAEDAEASARRALALNPDDTDALKVLARLCLDSERYTEAVQAYVAVLRLHPDDVETLLLVGNCYAEAGRPEDAKTLYQRVLRLDPGNAIAADNLTVVNGKERASGLAISTGLPVCCTQTSSEPSDGEPVPVSIIIPVFNRLDLTRQCLESIRRTSPVGRYEIVVVDNGSTDGTTEFLRQQQQAGHLRAIFNADNRGFAGACNQGARAAKSDYLLFLNNDTVPQAGWLEPLCEVLDRDHSVAAVGSKLLFPDGTLQHAGVIVALDERYPSSIMVPTHIGYKQPDHPEANRMRTYQSLTAACLLARRTAFEQAGGFDEGYWNGYEDVDLCFTLQAQGWKLVYRPESVLIHHESQGGPERLVKAGENLVRLNQRWLAKCEPDVIVKSDGSIIHTDAGRIQMYKLPAEASPNCLPSPIDGQTDTNLSEGADQKEETARPVASIIIVTYNSASTIRNCLDSVLSCASARIEVIVVDNASSDETRAILAEYKERITILEHSDNLGFSLACNQGIRASSGEYIVLLNPDTVVTPGWLERMKAHFGQDVGAVGPVSDFAAGLQNIDRHLPDGAPKVMELGEVTDLLARVNHGKGLQTRLLIGFCMMIPRRVLGEIGLLDEALFLGNDDLDLSWRLREKGYRLLVATDTFVHHKGQVSFKSAPSEQTSRLIQESTDRLYAKLEAHYGNGNVPPPMELWDIDWFRPSHAHFRPQASSPVQGLTSIIILAFNGLEHTIDCLKSINAYTPEPHEIIVVDNGSTDGTVDYLRRYSVKHENIRVIANSSNKGFAAGNNQGLSIARGEYLLLLNNDTVVTSGWLKGMLKLFKQHPDVGIVGPMSNYAMEPQLVPDAKYQSIPQMEAFAAKWSADHAGQSLPFKRVVGFCLMTTRRVIDLIGGLDERFGSGNFEDDDLCCRVALAGFQARIVQDVFIHHTGGQTFKIVGIDYSQSLDRNWELFKAKWGIPADAPYEKGYRFPSQTPQGSDLSIPLPDVGADHRCEDQGHWWQETCGEPVESISERPGRSQSAVTGEAPLSVVIIPNGHGLAPLWPSLVQHTKHPMAITILPSHGNGNGADPAHDVTCPDGWRISTSDLSAVRFLNELLQSADDDPVILLSSDLILTPGWLKHLLAALKRNSHIAVVGPTSNGGAAPQRIKAEYKGTGKSLRQFALRRAHRYGEELAEVDSLAPFCIVFKGSACRAIGPLREDLDLAASLHDYFARLRQAGRKVAVALDTYAHYEPHADLPSMGARRADAGP